MKYLAPFNFTGRLTSVGTGYQVCFVALFPHLMSIQILTLFSSLFTATNGINQGVSFPVASSIVSCCSIFCNFLWTFCLSEKGIYLSGCVTGFISLSITNLFLKSLNFPIIPFKALSIFFSDYFFIFLLLKTCSIFF